MAAAARAVERAPLARRTDLPPRPTRGAAAGSSARTSSARTSSARTSSARTSSARGSSARIASARPAVVERERPVRERASAAPERAPRQRGRIEIHVRSHDDGAGSSRRQTGLLRRSATVGTRSHSGDAGSTRRARATAAALAAATARAVPGDPLFEVVRRDAAAKVLASPTARVAHAASPQLSVVPLPRRRGAVRMLGVLCTLLVLVMLGAAAFQTQLARRQVELDRLDSDISAAREHYEELRRERAELRSPSNLSAVASEAGMVPATEAGFMVLSPEVLAEVQRSAGMIVGVGDVEQEDPLEQFREVKSITDGTP